MQVPAHVLLVVNPAARQVAAQPHLPAVAQERLRELGVESDLLLTAVPGEATEFARSAPEHGYDAVIVAGGDGTVNEVVNGLAGTGVPLGLIPLGTGNVLGDCLRLTPGDLEGACRAIAGAQVRAVDLGCVNGRRFAVMAGIGLDAQIAADTGDQWKSWLGKLAFVGQFVATLGRLSPWRFEAVIDGLELAGEAWGLFVCNGPRYAWRVRLAPDARDDDGLLDFVLLRACSRDDLRRIAAQLFITGKGAGTAAPVEVLRGATLTLRASPEAPWQVDGEVAGSTPVECHVEPGSLLLLHPVLPGRASRSR